MIKDFQLRRSFERIRAITVLAAIMYLAAPTLSWAVAPVPGRIEAEHYDEGGEGVGYHTGRGDWGLAYPRSDSMDIGDDPLASNGYAVGWTGPDQWFSYTISVSTPGTYNLTFLASSAPWAGSSLHATIDGVDVTGPVSVPAGGDYQTVQSGNFELTAGTHRLVIHFDDSNCGLDAFDLSPVVVLHNHTYTYNPAMSDEFKGGTLDTAKWLSLYRGDAQTLNDEWECYTDNLTRLMTGVSSQLVTRKVGPAHGRPASCVVPNYESGLIRSSAQQKYGYFEVSVKLPAGRGMWPAAWLIPGPNAANNYWPNWPPEIDIMEMVNNGREGPYQVTQFLHGCGTMVDASLVNQWGDYPSTYGAMNFADGAWHTFAAEWTPTMVYMYVDGVMSRSYSFNWDMATPAGDGFFSPVTCTPSDNGPAELIVNLAMGGGWAGEVTDAALPQTLEIRYVRVYSY